MPEYSPQATHDGPLRVVLLGSTGSIGRQTLDVASQHPEKVRVVALAAGKGDELLVSQARAFGVEHVALADPGAAQRAREALPAAEVGSGPDAVVALAWLPDADVVLNALVGAAGLRASMAALAAGQASRAGQQGIPGRGR